MTKYIPAVRDSPGEFAPEFARLNVDVLFGQEWNRTDNLSLRDRCIVTITTLMSKGILDISLQYHIQNAKKHDVTATEMAEILTHVFRETNIFETSKMPYLLITE